MNNGVACNIGLKRELATHLIRFEFWLDFQWLRLLIEKWFGKFHYEKRITSFINVFSMAYVVGPSMILWTWICNYSKCEHDPMILDGNKIKILN
jgi:hypothetical protein